MEVVVEPVLRTPGVRRVTEDNASQHTNPHNPYTLGHFSAACPHAEQTGGNPDRHEGKKSVQQNNICRIPQLISGTDICDPQ